jgi:hypothetical protein
MIGRVTGSLARVDRRAGMAVVQLGGERRQLVPLVEHLGELDQELERVEYRHALRPLWMRSPNASGRFSCCGSSGK